MADRIATDEIDSTFERHTRFDRTSTAFCGTHTHVRNNTEYRVTSEYALAPGADFLEGTTRYYADGELVCERVDWWPVNRRADGNTVNPSEASVEAFCRDKHARDPRSEIEYLLERVESEPPSPEA